MKTQLRILASRGDSHLLITDDENYCPSREGGVKKLGGRVSWRAIAAANPCLMRLGGSLALPISPGF
ncbi:MAG: hypothetical protein DMG06_08320 [Acidobacteria bacterium]|nr:MAG: hypothetical protein DMG06_08320 [Acidobacteriota bacterium]